MIHDVRIEMTGPGHGHVFIDGIEVHGVSKVSFTSEVDHLNVIVLEIYALNLSISAPCEVTRELVDVPTKLRSLFNRST